MPSVPNSEFLNKALNDASAPALLMSIIHMTGDTSVLQGDIHPQRPMMMDIQCGLSEEEQAKVRQRVLDCITQGTAASPTAEAALTDETIAQMLAFCVGETEIAPSHREMLIEELAAAGEDRKRVRVDPEAVDKAALKVAIIGAGMSGLLMAIKLQEAGIAFQIFEKNDGVGGTWFENRYPGCRVDISSHAYSYSFEPDYRWKHEFGQHQELIAYFSDIAKKHELLSKIQFNTEIESLKWSEKSSEWTLKYNKDGATQHAVASTIVSAVGQLNRPKIPNVRGRDSFAGDQMHTAQWDDAVSLDNKRVVVVGAGATAFQMVPELAKAAKNVTVFQRTPQWMISNPGYHNEVSEEHNWCFDNIPGYARWYRFISLWPMLDKSAALVAIDPEWDDGGLSCSKLNRAMRDNLTAYITSQVSDEDLLDKVIPQYPPFGTRILQDNGTWLTTLQKEHVHLIAEGVSEITPTGLVSTSGQKIDADVIVWATGFQTDTFVWPMEVIGKDNTHLSEYWSTVPQAYLGMTMPSFPNFFCLYGPNTNVAHTGNVILISECQVRYVMNALKLMCEKEIKALECKREVADDYEDRLDSTLAGMVWSHPNVHGFYRLEDSGRVAVNMPWAAYEYWQWTKGINEADYSQTG
ncbi:MAG: flavin-containing monooxygenase [Pseudomonadales bacterium]